MSRGRNISIANRLKFTNQNQIIKKVLLTLVLVFVFFVSTLSAAAASTPSYQYYNSGKEIGATGGQFGDGTTKLLQKAGEPNTYLGSIQTTYNTYGWLDPAHWFPTSHTCIAYLQIITNGSNSGSISTPTDLNTIKHALVAQGETNIGECGADNASAMSDFNQANISISGSATDTTTITVPTETENTKQISITVYSNKPANELPSDITLTLGFQDKTVDTAKLIFGDNLAVSNQVFFKNVESEKNYSICITPVSIFNFPQCQTVKKISGTILNVYFGSAETVNYKDGKVASITVDIISSSSIKNGTYGPLDIDLFSLTDLTKILQTKTTTTKTISGSNSELKLITDPNFDQVERGDYKVCIQKTELCSTFTKKINTKASVTISVPADKSDQFFTASTVKSTCGDQVTGIGWILCPIIAGLTKLNDSMWGLVSGLLKVDPIKQSDSIYAAWGTIRNIANVVFVIIFMIMIFSQLSSAGISNYGVKKLLPRLLIGAILVNLSFIIVQIAVDVANIVGSSLYDLLVSMTPAITPTWESLGALILKIGGTAAGTVAGAAVGVVLVGGPMAAFLMLAPLALMGALGLLAAVITLIFRQAVIPVLAILAPLAFVAYLLPNTESWFKKWRDLLIKMLVLYPLAALVFGGAQFAASVIIDGNTDNWWKVLIGLIMLTMPLFSLPFLASKGGAITDAVGKSLKGLVEKARKPIMSMAKEHEDLARSRYQAGLDRNGETRRRIPFGQRQYQNSKMRKKSRELDTKTNEERFGSQWANSDMGKAAIDESGFTKKQTTTDTTVASTRQDRSVTGVALNETLGVAKKEAHTEEIRANTRVEQHAPLDIRLDEKLAEANLKSAQVTTSRIATEATAGALADREARLTGLGVNATAATVLATGFGTAQREFDINSGANTSAGRIQAQELQEAFVNDTAGAATRAGGIDIYGVPRVQAGATSARARARSENVTAAATLFTAQGYTSVNMALVPGGPPVVNSQLMEVVASGTLRGGVPGSATAEQREAAMQMLVQNGDFNNAKMLTSYVATLPHGTPETLLIQQSLKDLFNASPKTPKAITGKVKGMMSTGDLEISYDDLEHNFVKEGRISAKTWADMDKNEAQDILNVLTSRGFVDSAGIPFEPRVVEDLRRSIEQSESDEQIRGLIPPEKRTFINQISVLLGRAPGTPATP